MEMHWEKSDAGIYFDEMAISKSTPLNIIASAGCIRSCKSASSKNLDAAET